MFMTLRKKGKHARRADQSARRRKIKLSKRGKPKSR